MIEQLFHVATEFRFDIGQALLSTKTLQDSVDNLSGAADNALLSFQHLGAGLVAHLGLGSGGLLTILGKAVQISDKFNSSSLSFSNIISSNMKVFGGTIDTFNDRLATSQMIMGNINKVANQFALPSGEMLQMTKVLTPLLAQHGMAGTNFSGSINMAKNVLKSAPNMNLDPAGIQNQLLNAVSGQAHMQGTLFPRLMRETSTFQDAHITSAAQFNAMKPEARIKLLDKALAVFASDTEVLKNRVDSLSGQMTILSNNFSEFGSVLKPIGDAILKPIVMVLKEVNSYIDHEGRQMAKSFGNMISNIFEDPKGLLVNILQMKQLGSDTKKGAKTMGIVEIVLLLRALKNFAPMAGIGMAVQGALVSVGAGLIALVRMIPFLAVFKFVVQGLWFAVSRLLPNMLAAVAIFQTISRAKAIAKVADAKNMLTLAPQFMDLFTRLKVAIENIFMPVGLVIDALAEFISPLFQLSTYGNAALPVLDALVRIMEVLGKVSILAYAGLQGIFFALFQFVSNIASGNIRGAFKGMKTAFEAGKDDVLSRNMNRMNQPGGAATNMVTNIGKVEIRNDFKENQEPDRIAFTLKEQLLKAAKNPTQGRGTALQGAFAR